MRIFLKPGSVVTHLAVHELVHVGDNHRALHIQQREAGRGVTGHQLLQDMWYIAYPLRPLQAPVAEPGLTKKRPSNSNASKLSNKSVQSRIKV